MKYWVEGKQHTVHTVHVRETDLDSLKPGVVGFGTTGGYLASSYLVAPAERIDLEKANSFQPSYAFRVRCVQRDFVGIALQYKVQSDDPVASEKLAAASQRKEHLVTLFKGKGAVIHQRTLMGKFGVVLRHELELLLDEMAVETIRNDGIFTYEQDGLVVSIQKENYTSNSGEHKTPHDRAA